VRKFKRNNEALKSNTGNSHFLKLSRTHFSDLTSKNIGLQVQPQKEILFKGGHFLFVWMKPNKITQKLK